ncbi:T9SS type A sorting domain-containing protein [Chryseobacterium sp. MEBOG07]|uniref:T9SS type A sorting domain-containing protein n=1 Tax=Chryseobacterium sp. MEBOG07 TaxID=2879939 RepID=UPI001F1AA18D|nr:T9SS type A sorting domain-containing protein [Chryseobacterium sp. MEBOG07]UKB80171.1 T9SS type A sorting domain-containing protein [Chryseobacterium sp. MEBOG07]
MKNIYFLLFLFNSILISSTVRYVNANSNTGIAPYASWSTASNDLQTVINMSQIGDEIWVASGTYIPTRDPFGNNSPSASQDKTFYLKDGISVYGGFNGTETSLTDRNINSNITILSGDIGTLGTITDNCYHVVLFSGNSANAIGVRLDGFSITNGFANGTVNNNVNGNIASRLAGPAIYFINGNNIISNNKIYMNSGYSGGGIYTSTSNTMISNNEIYNNKAFYDGGGVSVYKGTNTITNNYIHDNTATGDGGGIYAVLGVDNVISKNVIGKNKGGINQIDTYYYGGGGIYTEKGSNLIVNNVLYENTSNYMGGGIFLYYGKNKVINNTIYKNTGTRGGGFFTYLGNNFVKNNIFWGNINGTDSQPGADYKNHNDWPAENYFYNNLFQLPSNFYTSANQNSLYGYPNNIFQTNPNFKNEANISGADGILRTSDDGLSLLPNSIAINYGQLTDAPTDDITELVRMGNPDIGAYELIGNLGAAEMKINQFRIYPNPAKDVLNIETNDKILKAEIFNTLGQLIKTTKESKVDISEFPSGIYILNVVTENKVITEKFIKK